MFINGCLYPVSQIRWPEIISNNPRYQTTNKLKRKLEKNTRRWTWHIFRKPSGCILWHVLRWNLQGKRRSRLINTCLQDLESDVKTLNFTWQQMEIRANDWISWRFVVDLDNLKILRSLELWMQNYYCITIGKVFKLVYFTL